MAATFGFYETIGTTATPSTPTTANTYIHLLNTSATSGGSTKHSSYPITIPTSGYAYSYERYVRGKWTGTYSSISTVVFYKSAGTVGTGCTILAGDKGNQTFATPVVATSAIATAAIPTTAASGLSLGFSASYSDYVVLQLRVNASGAAGANGAITYKCQWNES